MNTFLLFHMLDLYIQMKTPHGHKDGHISRNQNFLFFFVFNFTHVESIS